MLHHRDTLSHEKHHELTDQLQSEDTCDVLINVMTLCTVAIKLYVMIDKNS